MHLELTNNDIDSILLPCVSDNISSEVLSLANKDSLISKLFSIKSL